MVKCNGCEENKNCEREATIISSTDKSKKYCNLCFAYIGGGKIAYENQKRMLKSFNVI